MINDEINEALVGGHGVSLLLPNNDVQLKSTVFQLHPASGRFTYTLDMLCFPIMQLASGYLIPYLTYADPDEQICGELIQNLMAIPAVSALELGIPFSDPLADGPVIQESHQRALANGATLSGAFAFVAGLRPALQKPLIFMLSYQLIFQYGLDKFAGDCQRCGVNGVIVPDLPPESAHDYLIEMRQTNVDTIFLVTPNADESRIKEICAVSRGFIYLVSVAGITGEREKINESLPRFVRTVREYTKLPIYVGFGISKPEQVKEVKAYAEGAIVGSAIVKQIAENLNNPDLATLLTKFVQTLSAEQH